MKPGHYLSDISGLCDLSDLSALSDIPGTRYQVFGMPDVWSVWSANEKL